ncbi:putative methionine-R-sulfoxide reductase SelR, partial [Hortaea werneckii]
MRLPSFLRTFYAFSNTTFHRAPTPFANATSLRPGTALRSISLPSIPFVGALFHTAETRKMSHPVQKSEQEWQAQLSPDQFRILREKGTEPPFSGDYDKHYPSSGTYACAGCSAPLYTADQKFKSGCGWPAFFDTVPGAVTRHVDRTFGMERIEIVCTNCGGHLGHVFKGEGYPTPTDERHCVNSVSLKFSNQDPVKEQTYDDYDNYEPRPRPRAHRPPPPDLDPYGPPPPGAIPVDSYHAPPPYPSSQRDGGRPPPPAGASDLPPPPMGEALKRRPSAM